MKSPVAEKREVSRTYSVNAEERRGKQSEEKKILRRFIGKQKGVTLSPQGTCYKEKRVPCKVGTPVRDILAQRGEASSHVKEKIADVERNEKKVRRKKEEICIRFTERGKERNRLCGREAAKKKKALGCNLLSDLSGRERRRS